MVNETETRTEKGISLARGPALMLGTILLAAGLYFLYRQHTFPKFSNFPNGNAPVTGKVLFSIFGANGWTGMLTAVAGGLLLFGAAQHLLAKAMSLIVGVALGAAAIIALASGNVLGLAAANGLTELAWGAAAAILLFNTIVPRRRTTVPVEPVRRERADTGSRRGEAAAAGVGAGAAGLAAEHEHRADEHRADEQQADEQRADERTAGGRSGSVGSEDGTAVHDRAVDPEGRTEIHDGPRRDEPVTPRSEQ